MISDVTPLVSFGRGTLKVAKRGKIKQSILLVVFNRPKSFHSINNDVYEDLIAVMEYVKNDRTLSGIVLTGMGKYFSSGADLKEVKEIANTTTITNKKKNRNTIQKPAGRFMMSLLEFPKLIGVYVNGPAVGIAVTLLYHCDIVHCHCSATFWAPFNRFALVPEFCSSTTFVETHGLSKANELLLLGRKINAQTAYDWNICSNIIGFENDNNNNSNNKYNHHHLQSTNDPDLLATTTYDDYANEMCNEIDDKLFSLPLGDRTSEYFIRCIRKGLPISSSKSNSSISNSYPYTRQERLRQICYEELLLLDERFNTGQVAIAAKAVQYGPSSKNNNNKKKQLQQQQQKQTSVTTARSKL